MKKSTKLIVEVLIGMAVGGVIGERVFWHDVVMPWQAKTVLFAIFFGLSFYYFLTHRTPDKERLDHTKL